MDEDLPGLAPPALAPAHYRVLLEDHAFEADIGFHAFEIGTRQRLLVTFDIALDPASLPRDDAQSEAWDYDFLRHAVARLTATRRFNLQETLARELYDLVAARAGVVALRIHLRKRDVYPDCAAVGVVLASAAVRPQGPSPDSTNA